MRKIYGFVRPSTLLVGLLGGVGLWTLAWNSPAAKSASFGVRWALGLSNIPVWVPDPWGSAAAWLSLIQPGDLGAIAGLAVLCTALVQLMLVLASISTTQTESPLMGDPSSWVVIGQADDHRNNRPSGQN